VTPEGTTAVKNRHVVLRYTTLRIAIFVVALVVLRVAFAIAGVSLAGGSALLYLMLAALLISGLASFFLLNKQRDAMSEAVVARSGRLNEKVKASASMEDDE
jgi:hypothetical protein